MSCRKAYDVDLAGYVADPTGAVWTEFRDHYPRCAPCSAEVRAWTELTSALAAGTHPDPDALLGYVDRPAALSPRIRHAIADHLARCAACRDEARTLRTFDPLADPVAPRVARRRFALPSLVGRIVWNPAFAYTVALAVGLYPLLSGRTVPEPVAVSLPAPKGSAAPRVATDRPAAFGDEARRRAPEQVEEKVAHAPASPPAGTAAPVAAPKSEPAREPAPEPAKERRPVEPPAEAAAPAARAPSPPPPASITARGRADDRGTPDVGTLHGGVSDGGISDGGASDGGASDEGASDVAAQPLRREARRAPMALGKSVGSERIVLHAGEETRATTGHVRISVAGAPPEVDRLRLRDERGRRIEIPWTPSSGDARLDTAWLQPGPYTVELLAGDRVVATATLRIEAR